MKHPLVPYREEPSLEGAERFFFADVARAWALFLIVLVHIACCPCVYAFANDIGWWVANCFDSLGRPGVPLFIMLSGMLLLDPRKTETLGVFFRKRITKVLIPFLAFQLVYSYVLISGPFFSVATLGSILSKASYPHLGFVFYLLPLYFATPILRVYISHADKSNQLYFIALWFITAIAFPAVKQFCGFEFGFQPYLAVAAGYVGYFVLGHFLRDMRLHTMKWRLVFLVILAVSVAITAGGTYGLTRATGVLNESFYGYLTPNVVGMTICVWLLLRSFSSEEPSCSSKLHRFITAISLRSYSIYLVHFLIWYPLKSKGILGFKPSVWLGTSIDCTMIHPMVGIPVVTIIVILLSFLVVTSLRTIMPFTRIFLP